MEQKSGSDANAEVAFRGYAPPTSSTTYTPNQFFDVVLPNSSRGCLRLVAYLIRKTLGWSDANGNPQNPEATISYRELDKCAGIGRGRVKEAIDEAIASQFVECLRFGKPHQAGDEGYSALYSLKWGRQDRYVTDRREFDGFFAGNGNLTHIPNEFFDHTIPSETLAVVKVVGVIIRNTIGFQTKFGFRRQEAALSFSDIMRKAAIGSRTTVSGAIKAAIEGNHIRVVTQGIFDANAGVESRAAVYGVNWSDEYPNSGSAKVKTPRRRRAIVQGSHSDGPTVATAPELDRGETSQTGPDNTPGTGPVSAPNQDREEPQNWTANKTTSINNSSKQQQSSWGVENQVGAAYVLKRLVENGIEPRTAARLLTRFPEERIQRQLDWIPLRHVKSSRTGLLIRAIEHDICEPRPAVVQDTGGRKFAASYYAELGGNLGLPIAQPSEEEACAAAKILVESKAGQDFDEYGRAFARFIQRRCQHGKFLPQSLILAMRLHGDAFVADRKKSSPRVESRSSCQDEAVDEYKAYVIAEVRKLFDDPDHRASFEADVAARLESCRRLSERGFQMLRREMENLDGQMELFTEFIKRRRPSLLLDFHSWQAQHKRTGPKLSIGDSSTETATIGK